MLSLFYALFIPLHDDCYEDVLDGGIEKDHEDDEIDLTRETLGPGL